MRTHLIKLGAALTAITAFAVGGSALASAAHKTAPPAPAAQTQQGDQTSSDATGAQTERVASESGPSDGPGGYADTNANADTQQQGEH